MTQIIISGLARTGKDTAAKYLAKKYGLASYTFSSVLAEMLHASHEKSTKKKMIGLGDRLREENGMDAIAKLLDKKITQTGNIILVGPRSIEEVEYFRKKFPKLAHAKITSQKAARFSRKSKLDPPGKEEFFQRDESDLHTKGFQKVLDSAEYEIKNDSTKKELFNQLDLFMKWVLEREK